jgi:hypothetical protein
MVRPLIVGHQSSKTHMGPRCTFTPPRCPVPPLCFPLLGGEDRTTLGPSVRHQRVHHRALDMGWLGRLTPLGWASVRRPWAGLSPLLFIPFSFFNLNSRNLFKLTKLIEICRNLRKIQNKFCVNPYEQIYPDNLTTSSFSQ